MDEPEWYPAWRHQAVQALFRRNTQMNAEFRLGEWARYDYDLPRRALNFSHEGQLKVTASAQVIGTTSNSASDWLWAWANSSLPPDVTQSAAAVKVYGETHSITELTASCLGSDEPETLGWELAGIAAHILDAQGVYRSPSRNGAIFFLLTDLRFVS